MIIKRNIAFLILCVLLNGCLHVVPHIKIPVLFNKRYLSYQLEKGYRQSEIRATQEKVWQAGIEIFRQAQIIESDTENMFIKALDDNVIYEFKVKRRTPSNSAFTIKAYILDTLEPQTVAARKMAARIYKRARSTKLFIKRIVIKE